MALVEKAEPRKAQRKVVGSLRIAVVTYEHHELCEGDGPTIGQQVDAEIKEHRRKQEEVGAGPMFSLHISFPIDGE